MFTYTVNGLHGRKYRRDWPDKDEQRDKHPSEHAVVHSLVRSSVHRTGLKRHIIRATIPRGQRFLIGPAPSGHLDCPPLPGTGRAWYGRPSGYRFRQ